MRLALIAVAFCLVGCGGVDLHTVALTWDAIAQPGETYRVYRDNKPVATVPAKKYTDRPGKGTHRYTVTGVVGTKESPHSNTFTAKVP